MSLLRPIPSALLALLVVFACSFSTAAFSASLTSISVTPSNASISTGNAQQFIATGTYSDSSTQNLTSSVTWSSSNTAALAVNSSGVGLGLIPGTASLQATLGSISGSTSVVVINSNLSGWWQFDAGSGTTAVDSSGNANTGTVLNGVTWVAGQIGEAISTNGTNQYASIPAIDLSSTKAVTWAAWVNRTYASGSGALIEDSTNFNISTTGFGFFPDDSPDCGIANTMMTGVYGNVGYTLSCYAQPTSGVWHHIAAVYDKSQTGTKVISLYIDGVLQTPVRQMNTSTNTNAFGANPVYLFSRGGGSNFAAGKMDDLRLYKTALSSAQIQQIYQQGLGTLNSITVTPASWTLAAGATLQYVATGNYSSGSTLNLTSAATWNSSNTATATIGATGVAIGVGTGSTNIQATCGAVTGSANLTVQAGASLVSLAVTPFSFTIPPGGMQQLTATGTYSDGSTQNLTNGVTWSSTNTAAATVSTTGLVTAATAGSSSIGAVLGSVSGTAVATVSSISNLVGWWQFDDGSGTTAADSSGNGETASLFNGVSWITGQIDNAISTNGTSQYASIPAIDLSSTQAVSWAAWVNRTYGTGVGALIEDSANFNASNTGFGFFPDDSPDCGIANSMMTGVHGNVGYTLSCYTQPTSGVWHHVAAVYDKSQTGTKVISLYIDGVLQTPVLQMNTSTNTNSFGNDPIYLFSRGGVSNFAAGKIDDLRLFNAALTAAQIQQIYQQGLGTLSSITVTPANGTLTAGATLQYAATGNYSNGSTLNLTSAVTWSSTNTAAATVGSLGLATGIAAGTTNIRAAYNSVTGSTGLIVQAGLSLVSIAVTPASFTLPSGGTQQLTATGTYSDNTTQNLTSAVTWSSNNTAAATVSGSGLVTAVANGSASIHAVLGSVSGSAAATIATGSNLIGWWQFDDGSGTTAVDSSGNGDTATLFNSVVWSTGQVGDAISANGTNQYALIPSVNLSSTQAITWAAWVNRTYGSGSGALIEDSTNFNASTTGFGFFPDDSPDCGSANTMMMGVHGDVGYTLSCYTQPTSGVWHHLAAVFDKSQTGASALSLYIDGVLQTPVLKMNTSTNTNTFGTNPIYLFSRSGASNFAAGKMDDLRLYKNALTASQIQQIYQQGFGTLSSITVTPANGTLAGGATLQYTATGNYSGGSTLNLTGAATWTSTNTAAATISTSGLASGLATGSTNIQATYNSVTGSTGLTVQAGPSLVSIAVTPASFSIPPGGTEQLMATGTYSDNTTQNLTSAVTWSSTNAGAASVNASGLVTAVANGNAAINAILGTVGGSAQATVTTISNLVGWWPFDDGSGTTAVDSSGNGDTASLFNGVGWTTGQIGKAISANGTSQYASIPAINLSTTQAVTWAAWVNRAYGSGAGALIEDSSNFNVSTTGFGFFPDDSPDCGAPNTMMTAVHGNVGYSQNCYAQPTSGVWHHIAVVYDKSQTGAKVISLYIDGVLQTPVSQPHASTNTNAFGNDPIYLFARGGASNFAGGEMDDLRLYNTGLTATQIEAIYTQGLGSLINLTVSPADTIIAPGATQRYAATGTYSNGPAQNLTSLVTWSSSNTGAATINSTGLATGVAVGSTSIQAVLSSVTGSTSLTVSSGGPVLQSILVTPASFAISPGGTQQLTATGTYSDGTSQNLTTSVVWSSSTPSLATVSTTGLVTGIAVGTTNVKATYASIVGQTSMSVVPSTGTFIQWTSGDSGSTLASTTYQDQNATTGDLVLVFSHWDNQSLTATVHDQMGNTYIPIFPATNVSANDRFQVWYAANIIGGARLAVTATYSGQTTSISTVDAMEYSGLTTSSPLDVYASATGTGTAQSTGNMPTTTTGSETIIGLFGYGTAATPYNPGAGYSFRNYDATTFLEDMEVSSTGVYSATTTSTAVTPWVAFGMSFRNELPFPPGLSVNPGTVIAGTPSTGTISLVTPAPSGGAVVTLSSSLPSVVGIPASVTVPAGQSLVTFPITTSAVTFTTTVSVYATYGSTVTAYLTVTPTVMAQIASDAFNRANSATLGSNWTPLAGGGSNAALQVVNGQIEDAVASSVGKEMYYGGLNWTPDQYSQVQIVSASGGGNEGPAVRMTSTDTHYACVVYNLGSGNASVSILLDFAGSYATLASSSTATVSAGDLIRCTVQGTSLTMTDVTTATNLLTASDGNIPSGYPGLIDAAGGTASNYVMANWSAGASAASLTATQYASDNFARANALSLGSNWVVGPGHGPIQIVTDQIQPYPAGGIQPSKEHFIAYGLPPNDQWSQLQVVVQDTVGDLAVELRASDSVDNMYVCDVNLTGGPGVGEARIVKVLNGAITTLVTDQQWSTINPGDSIRGQVQGSLISLIDQTTGSLLLSAFDTALTTGYSGISMQAVTGTASDHIAANWSAGGFQ